MTWVEIVGMLSQMKSHGASDWRYVADRPDDGADPGWHAVGRIDGRDVARLTKVEAEAIAGPRWAVVQAESREQEARREAERRAERWGEWAEAERWNEWAVDHAWLTIWILVGAVCFLGCLFRSPPAREEYPGWALRFVSWSRPDWFFCFVSWVALGAFMFAESWVTGGRSSASKRIWLRLMGDAFAFLVLVAFLGGPFFFAIYLIAKSEPAGPSPQVSQKISDGLSNLINLMP